VCAIAVGTRPKQIIGIIIVISFGRVRRVFAGMLRTPTTMAVSR